MTELRPSSSVRPLATALALALALAWSAAPASAAKPKQAAKAAAGSASDASLFEELPWREVGPYRGGRVAAVEGVPSQPLVYYFGATGGGVWKTTDGGATWKNVSDGFFGGSIGAVAVSEWDPNVVYVGGGEKTVRGNVSHGDGMWKSTDAGKTWTHVGLADSRHIPRIRIHPKDPDLVYAAVLGHLFGPSDERGVYRSRDGGKSWQRVLFANRDAGAVDLVLDPTNPRVVYASTWRVRRTPWSLESGGPGSGLWKSTDGGDTWKELTRKPGLPQGTVGIIGITVSPSDPQNLYTIVEAEDGGVFRSRDGGETWTKTNEDRELRQRAWYYTRINADPKDADTVYVLNVRFHKSKDGGKTFTAIRTPHSDNHDLWIAPDDPRRMIESNDGGANVSTDGGATWTTQANQPTSQIYRVSTDDAFPYRLLGAQQDNSALRIRHRSTGGGIGEDDWEETAGGESGHIVAHPLDPDVVYGGSYGGFLTVVNHRSEEVRDVNPWPDNPMGWGAAGLTHRFQWNFPIFFSPHPPHALYAAAEVLFRSTDGGASWQAISPDLTRNDTTKMGPSGGPITKDNTSVEYYGTIFAALESPHEPGVLWAGSDDGLLHLSRDGGATWTNVTPKGMPEWILVNSLEAHPFEKGGLYVAATMYKHDDFRPYIYKTTDYGKSWTKITDGIAADHFTRVVRADPGQKGLLFAGTERGAYVSFDDGGRWQQFQGKLPIVPVTDMAVKDGDLIAATQGRGFWILDDLSWIRALPEVTPEATSRAVHLFEPGATWRIPGSDGRPRSGQGTNPPGGVTLTYLLKDPQPGTKLKLEFLGGDGTVIRSFHGEVAEVEKKKDEAKAGAAAEETPEQETQPLPTGPGTADPAALAAAAEAGAPGASEQAEEQDEEEDERKKKDEPKLPAEPGINRFTWDLRHPNAEEFEGLVLWGGGTAGPLVVPGSYRARLTVGSETVEVPFVLKADPRSKATPADLEAQHDFLLGVRDKLTEVHREIGRIREVRAQLGALRKQLAGNGTAKPLIESAKAIDKEMTAVEEALYQTKNRSPQDPLNFPIRLNDKLAALGESAAMGSNAPTAQALAVGKELTAAIDAELAKLRTIWDERLPAFNRQVAEAGVAAVWLKPVETDELP